MSYSFGTPYFITISRGFLGGFNQYRFSFNGKENDKEVKGEGNQQDYGMRIYDPRAGRFLSVDPLTREYSFYSPYQYAGNTPIEFVDLDGCEPNLSPFMISPPGNTIIATQYASAITKALIYGTIGFVFSVPNMVANMHASGNSNNPQIKAKFENEAKNELANFVVGNIAGAAFKGLIKSVGRVLGSEAAATSNSTNSLFRGDSRRPGDIFKEGFESKGKNTSIPDYVEANEPSIFVGTSKSISEASAKAPTGYVYTIENNGKGLDVNNYYKAVEGRNNPYAAEQEIIFDAVIPPSQIKGAFPVINGEINLKGFIPNPGFKPATKK